MRQRVTRTGSRHHWPRGWTLRPLACAAGRTRIIRRSYTSASLLKCRAGQAELERRPGDDALAAGGAGEAAREGEPETGPAGAAEARREDPLGVLVGDAGPVVGDDDQDVGAGAAHLDADVVLGVAERVLDQWLDGGDDEV